MAEFLTREWLIEQAKIPSDINEHLLTIYEEAMKTDCKILVELGVGIGNSTKALLTASKLKGGVLYSFDIENNPKIWCKYIGGWKYEVGDSRELWKEWKQPIDVLFLDTSHFKEDTIIELNWLDFLKPNGVALFHDIVSFKDGVLVPILDWSKNRNVSFRSLTNCNGLGILRFRI